MLRFLRNLLRRKDTVEYLRELWRTKPSAAVAERLFRALVDAGTPNGALAFIKEALRTHPHVERIRELYQQALRVRSAEEIRSLRAALGSNGRPEIYARLGELYRYLGHFEEALEIAREGIRRYPNWSGNYAAIGLVHYSRFLKTCSAHDGHQAETYLTKASALDSKSFKTLYYLACLYVCISAKRMAAQCIERLSALMPGDGKVAELAARVQKLADGPDNANLDYFRRYEAQNLAASRNASGRTELATGLKPGKVLDARLAQIAAIQGVKGVYVVDQHGKTIAGAGQVTDASVLEAAVHGMLEGARVNSRRMSIGTFNRAMLASREWRVFLYEIEGCGLAVLGGRTTRQDLVQRKVSEFVEECLCEVQGA